MPVGWFSNGYRSLSQRKKRGTPTVRAKQKTVKHEGGRNVTNEQDGTSVWCHLRSKASDKSVFGFNGGEIFGEYKEVDREQ